MTEQKGMLNKVMELDIDKELKNELLSTVNMSGIDGSLDIPFLADNDLLSQEAADIFLRDIMGSSARVTTNDNNPTNELKIITA